MQISTRRNSQLERLEDRAMLTSLADVVFAVDESTSTVTTATLRDWLNQNVDDIDAAIRAGGVTDVRYGLTGYVNDRTSSYLLSGDSSMPANERLFTAGTNPQDHLSQLSTAFNLLQSSGQSEDG